MESFLLPNWNIHTEQAARLFNGVNKVGLGVCQKTYVLSSYIDVG
jgi:hypothetical protein